MTATLGAAGTTPARDGMVAERRSRLRGRGVLVAGIVGTALILLLAIVGPALAPYDPVATSLLEKLQPPGESQIAAGQFHLFGTDQLGRDVLSRVLHAARVTVLIATVAVLLSMVVGTSLGLVSGYLGGAFDMILMRIVDVQLAFPLILLALVIIAVLGTGIPILIVVFVIAGWVSYVRVIRAETLLIKERPYVEAARSVGATDVRIVLAQVLPNVLTQVIILINIEVGRMILVESALSYLGLGIQPPLPTWGNMLFDGQGYVHTAWWMVLFPGLAIVITVLGVNLLGEGLRAIYDPQSRVDMGKGRGL